MSEDRLPPGTTLLLKGGQVLTPTADWHDPPQLDIAIAGERIAGVAPAYAMEPNSAIEVIDARGHLIVPGFVKREGSIGRLASDAMGEATKVRPEPCDRAWSVRQNS
jgi:predicted amidohydrolase